MTSRTTRPFFIPDTSPLLAYSPCVDCVPPGAGGGSWKSDFRPRGDGYDQTFHQVVGGERSGVSVAVNVTATSLNFYTSPSPSEINECSTQYSVNSSTWLDACRKSISNGTFVIDHLPIGLHRVELRMKNYVNATGLEFMGFGGELDIVSSDSMSNLTIDNTSPSFLYFPSNNWTSIGPNGAPMAPPANTTVGSTLGDMSGFYNNTAGVSTVSGGRAELSFQGQAIYVYGLAGPEGGTAEVHLDSQLQQTINMTGKWSLHSSLLYVGGGFNPNDTHTLSITNTSPGRQMVIDYAMLTVPHEASPASSSTAHLALIVGLIAGISIVLLIAGAITYVMYTRRRSRRIAAERRIMNTTPTPYPFATGIGKDPSTSEDDWRLHRVQSASPSTPYSSDGPPGINGRGFAWGIGGDGIESNEPYRSPPPKYPDYIPYRPPADTSSHNVVSEFSETIDSNLPYIGGGSARSPPLIAGATPLATGWLSTQRGRTEEHVTSPAPSQTSSSSRRSGSGRSREGRSSIPLISRRGDRSTEGYVEIALDHYDQSQRHGRSPSPASASTPSTQELVVSPKRAVGGSRSVARLWPKRDAVPSSHRTPSLAQKVILPGLGTIGHKLGTNNVTHHQAFDLNRRNPIQGSQCTSTATSASSPNVGAAEPDKSSVNDGRGTSLRRGVSIKSVKTMRSFFSGLLFVPSSSSTTSPISSIPALPQTAARPDSDIFPGLAGGDTSIKSDRMGGDMSMQNNRSGDVRDGKGGDMGRSAGLGLVGVERKGIQTRMNRDTSLKVTPFLNEAVGLGGPSINASQIGTNDGGLEEGKEASPNLFIELNPNSPITASRPDSQWTGRMNGSRRTWKESHLGTSWETSALGRYGKD
ncbi:hypothetical protein IAR55_005268 [Kwoniella newhampshirensis]|uniref:Uncharacterized protein n=1 Tax=Kwoniella newhampshirensis TaxID=1651941 RepID=A0AAW0YH20_9TREE